MTQSLAFGLAAEVAGLGSGAGCIGPGMTQSLALGLAAEVAGLRSGAGCVGPVVAQSVNIVVNVAVAADLTGVRGVTLLGAGRIGDNSLVVVAVCTGNHLAALGADCILGTGCLTGIVAGNLANLAAEVTIGVFALIVVNVCAGQAVCVQDLIHHVLVAGLAQQHALGIAQVGHQEAQQIGVLIHVGLGSGNIHVGYVGQCQSVCEGVSGCQIGNILVCVSQCQLLKVEEGVVLTQNSDGHVGIPGDQLDDGLGVGLLELEVAVQVGFNGQHSKIGSGNLHAQDRVFSQFLSQEFFLHVIGQVRNHVNLNNVGIGQTVCHQTSLDLGENILHVDHVLFADQCSPIHGLHSLIGESGRSQQFIDSIIHAGSNLRKHLVSQNIRQSRINVIQSSFSQSRIQVYCQSSSQLIYSEAIDLSLVVAKDHEVSLGQIVLVDGIPGHTVVLIGQTQCTGQHLAVAYVTGNGYEVGILIGGVLAGESIVDEHSQLGLQLLDLDLQLLECSLQVLGTYACNVLKLCLDLSLQLLDLGLQLLQLTLDNGIQLGAQLLELGVQSLESSDHIINGDVLDAQGIQVDLDHGPDTVAVLVVPCGDGLKGLLGILDSVLNGIGTVGVQQECDHQQGLIAVLLGDGTDLVAVGLEEVNDLLGVVVEVVVQVCVDVGRCFLQSGQQSVEQLQSTLIQQILQCLVVLSEHVGQECIQILQLVQHLQQVLNGQLILHHPDQSFHPFSPQTQNCSKAPPPKQ